MYLKLSHASWRVYTKVDEKKQYVRTIYDYGAIVGTTSEVAADPEHYINYVGSELQKKDAWNNIR